MIKKDTAADKPTFYPLLLGWRILYGSLFPLLLLAALWGLWGSGYALLVYRVTTIVNLAYITYYLLCILFAFVAALPILTGIMNNPGLHISEDGIRFVAMPAWDFRIAWEDVTKIDRYWGFQSLFFAKADIDAAPIWKWFYGMYYTKKLDKRPLVIAAYEGWKSGDIQREIEQYAPHLFEEGDDNVG